MWLQLAIVIVIIILLCYSQTGSWDCGLLGGNQSKNQQDSFSNSPWSYAERNYAIGSTPAYYSGPFAFPWQNAEQLAQQRNYFGIPPNTLPNDNPRYMGPNVYMRGPQIPIGADYMKLGFDN